MSKRRAPARRLSWLLVAGLVAGAVLIPAAAPVGATESHQDLPIVGNDFNNQDCSDKLGAGWIFVNAGSHDETGAVLTATFKVAGTVTANGFTPGNGVVHYYVPVDTGDTLLAFSDNINGDGPLNLSHVCASPEASEEPSSEPPSEEPSSEAPSEPPSEEPSSEAPSEPPSEEPSSEAPSEPPSEEPSSEAPSEPPSEEPSSEAPSEPPSEEPSSEAPTEEPSVPGGGVEGETGTPGNTLPPTDTLANGSETNSNLQIVLLGMAGLLTVVLLVTPAGAVKRKKR